MVSTETLPLIVPPAEGKVLEDLVLWVLRRPSPTFLSPPSPGFGFYSLLFVLLNPLEESPD